MSDESRGAVVCTVATFCIVTLGVRALGVPALLLAVLWAAVIVREFAGLLWRVRCERRALGPRGEKP